MAGVKSLLVFLLLLMPGAAAAQSPGLAVLPFASPDPARAYFAHGFSEDLIRDLARLPGVRLIARQTAATYTDATTLRRELRLDYVLSGRVGLHDGRLRLTAVLDGAEGEAWKVERDADPDSVLDLRHELAVRVAGTLGQAAPASPPTT